MMVRVRDDALHAVVDDGGRARSYGVV